MSEDLREQIMAIYDLPHSLREAWRAIWNERGGSAREPGFTCPRCGMTSYNENDIREGYCGNCHDWTGKPQ